MHNTPNFWIGDYVYIGGGGYIWGLGGIKIGSGTILGPRVTIHTVNHRYENADYIPFDNHTYQQEVIIGENVWIGDNAMICPGVKVGNGAVIAMGSVVSKDVPDYSIVAGNPAIVKKERNVSKFKNLEKRKKQYMRYKFEYNLNPIYEKNNEKR